MTESHSILVDVYVLALVAAIVFVPRRLLKWVGLVVALTAVGFGISFWRGWLV